MIERFFPTVPWLGNFLNALGGVIGDPVNCARMLEMDEAIIVFPEGVRGSGKLYRKRYQLQRFGNGFMHLAMTHRAPIVPVGIVGCEETMPALANLAPVAKLARHSLPADRAEPAAAAGARVPELRQADGLRRRRPAKHEVSEQVEAVKAELRRLIQVGLDERTSVY